mmetsp:Transcript_161065/g.516989  ORF Transcript_161065/g.516989 Transcript_161065/m.516989 type:complete len:533 (-) Transcript_161065:1584-3182(-)
MILVDLSHLGNLLPGDLLLLHLLLNLRAHDLGVAQRLDEFLVIQDVAGGRAEECQDLVFQLLQLRLGLSRVQHEIDSFLLGLRLLGCDTDAQHLILKTVQGGHEIEDANSNADLRREVWVRQLSRDVKPEVLRPLDSRVTKAHHHQCTLLEGRLLQDGIQDGIQGLLDVLQDNRVSKLDRVLELAHIVHVQAQHLQRLAVHLFHPLVRLPLRIDHQRPASGIVQDDGIVDAERVVGQAIDDPLAHFHCIADAGLQAELLARRHLQDNQPLKPLGDRLGAVRRGEYAQVRDDTRGDHDVTCQVEVVLAQSLALLGPRGLLTAKTVDQLLRTRKFRCAILLLFLKCLGLLVRFRKLGLETRDHVHDLLQLGLLGFHRCLGFGDFCLGLCQLQLLWAHLLGNLVVHDHGTYPLADTHGGRRSLFDLLRLELFADIQRHDLVDHCRWDVVLVELLHPVDELRVGEQLGLGSTPPIVNLTLAIWGRHLVGLDFEHDASGLGSEHNTNRRSLHAAHLTDISLRQLAEGIYRRLEGRKG